MNDILKLLEKHNENREILLNEYKTQDFFSKCIFSGEIDYDFLSKNKHIIDMKWLCFIDCLLNIDNILDLFPLNSFYLNTALIHEIVYNNLMEDFTGEKFIRCLCLLKDFQIERIIYSRQLDSDTLEALKLKYKGTLNLDELISNWQ